MKKINNYHHILISSFIVLYPNKTQLIKFQDSNYLVIVYLTGITTIITCNNCNMQQMKEFCPAQYYAQVFFLIKPKQGKALPYTFRQSHQTAVFLKCYD